MSALVWWLIPLTACTGALIYVWWSINAKGRQDTYKSISEYETFRSAFAKDGRENETTKNETVKNETTKNETVKNAKENNVRERKSKERKR